MLFTSHRRGRPRQSRPSIDLGTPELQAKRRNRATLEPLDLCLERRLITPEQHAAGIRLRWLYAQRFGAPTLATSDPSYLGGRNLRSEHTAKQEHIEREYLRTLEILEQLHAKAIVTNICIFSLMPASLATPSLHIPAKAIRLATQLHHFQNGLEALIHGSIRPLKP